MQKRNGYQTNTLKEVKKSFSQRELIEAYMTGLIRNAEIVKNFDLFARRDAVGVVHERKVDGKIKTEIRLILTVK